MMKLHSQNNQSGIFSLKRESWRRGHRTQHDNSDLVLRSFWLFGGILIIFFFLERGVDNVSWFVWGCFVNEANIIPFGIFSWHATSWITWGDIWDWPILYRLLSLSYNQRRALHIVPIVVELPVSTSLFISAFVLFSCYIVFILIQSIRRYEVNENGLSSLCRCNISVAFVLQMWRAESLKAGAGSRSKAAKPCPPHPRLSATMLWARGEWASGGRRGRGVEGGVSLVSMGT